jgi:hypothetical protein
MLTSVIQLCDVISSRRRAIGVLIELRRAFLTGLALIVTGAMNGCNILAPAAYVIGGAYLVLGQITVAQLRDGPLGALEGRPLALLGWLALAVVAFGYQWLDMRRARFEAFSRAGLLRG